MKFFNLRKDKATLPTFKAITNSTGELTLEIYDVIGEDFFGTGITLNSVSDAIKSAGDFSSVKLRINSPGGDLFQGVGIYNYLRSLGKPVNVVVDGLAASAASLIAMAGDTRLMGEGAVIMIHNAMLLAMGNAVDLRAAADLLDTVSASAAEVYVARVGMEKKDVQKLMDAETWMGAQECIDLGFATGMATSSGVSAKALASSFNLSVFNNTPEALKDEAPPVVEPTEPEYVEDPLISLFRARLDLLRSIS